jgi:hypothetical protein
MGEGEGGGGGGVAEVGRQAGQPHATYILSASRYADNEFKGISAHHSSSPPPMPWSYLQPLLHVVTYKLPRRIWHLAETLRRVGGYILCVRFLAIFSHTKNTPYFLVFLNFPCYTPRPQTQCKSTALSCSSHSLCYCLTQTHTSSCRCCEAR